MEVGVCPCVQVALEPLDDLVQVVQMEGMEGQEQQGGMDPQAVTDVREPLDHGDLLAMVEKVWTSLYTPYYKYAKFVVHVILGHSLRKEILQDHWALFININYVIMYFMLQTLKPTPFSSDV